MLLSHTIWTSHGATVDDDKRAVPVLGNLRIHVQNPINHPPFPEGKALAKGGILRLD